MSIAVQLANEVEVYIRSQESGTATSSYQTAMQGRINECNLYVEAVQYPAGMSSKKEREKRILKYILDRARHRFEVYKKDF